MNNHSHILANINKHIELTEAETRYFTSFLACKKLTKKELILRADQYCQNINFVNSGALRAYFINSEGRESTIMFAVKDWWITDIHGFIKQKPAMVNIEAIEASEVLVLSKKNLENLYVEIPKFERFFRIIMQNAYIREQVRVLQNLSLSAEKRYENFLAKYPTIAQQITQKQIASYLGITPEFLSMIRRRNAKS